MKVRFFNEDFKCFTKNKVYQVLRVMNENFVEVIDDNGDINDIDIDYAEIIFDEWDIFFIKENEKEIVSSCHGVLPHHWLNENNEYCTILRNGSIEKLIGTKIETGVVYIQNSIV